ncbi:MAG: PP2C family serine/threonine-protein phosphatase [Enterococcus aquimarinus]
MIGFYKMSLIGSSHLSDAGGVCQDSNDAKTLPNGWVVASIADGLGSARHSDVGSSLAVSEVLRFISSNVPEVWHDESLISLFRTAYHSAYRLIKERAEKDGNPAKDYDTTLTTVIYNGSNAVFGHVGDGGIITLNPYGDFSILTKAQKGDEFNSVTPLRSGPDNWIFGVAPESVAALLMLTDGIYDVACPWLIAKQEQKIYVNYVRPFMDRNILSVKTAADFENAQKEVEDFLNSEQSRQITDDKTILAIINTDILPEVKPDEYYDEPNWKHLAEEHRAKLYGSKTESPIAKDNISISVPDEEVKLAESEEGTPDETNANKDIDDTIDRPSENKPFLSWFGKKKGK